MTNILIGVVTHGKKRYALDHLLTCIRKQTRPSDVLFVVSKGQDAYGTLIRSKNVDRVSVLEDPSDCESAGAAIVSGRNLVKDYALKNNYDYVLFVDSDVMIPGLATELLLQAKADVVAGAYLNIFNIEGKDVIAPVIFKDLGSGEAQLYKYEAIAKPQVLDVGAAGLGCVLVKRNVLEKISFRAFDEKKTGTDAMAFFVDARQGGFSCKAHTGVKCLHMPFPLTDERAKVFEWRKTVRTDTANAIYN